MGPRKKPSKDDLNILLLGETGIGKSTWINAVANYCKFSSLEEASDNMASEMIALIPSKFTFVDKGEPKKIEIGKKSQNEQQHITGGSATQATKDYQFQFNGKTVNLIDTPGIGDTDGIEKDKANFDNILSFISYYDNLHAVCILLKPDQARLTAGFKFCLIELLTHLHKSLAENIIFCFTHTRGTDYGPGETYFPLEELLKKNKIDISLDDEKTYFCMDNEAFRLLACIKNGIHFDKRRIGAYKDSWSIASEMLHKMIEHIQSLPPHDIKNTLSMNEARNIVLALTEPMKKVMEASQETLDNCNKWKKEIEICDTNIGIERKRKFRGLEVVSKNLEVPQTVCVHADCVEMVRVGQTKLENIVYKTICHSKCTVKGGHTGKNNPYITRCRIFWGLGYFGVHCRKCRHSWEDHQNMTYTTEFVEKEFLSPEAATAIRNLQTKKEQKEREIKECNLLRDEYLAESDILSKIAAQFSSFMKNSALGKDSSNKTGWGSISVYIGLKVHFELHKHNQGSLALSMTHS